MANDLLPARKIKIAVIHEPKKGLLPKKSCLKRRSESQESSSSSAENNVVRDEQQSNTTSGQTSAADSDNDNSLFSLIRDDADFPRDRSAKHASTNSSTRTLSHETERTHQPISWLKRKRDDIGDAEEKVDSKKAQLENWRTRAEIRKVVKQKVREANRAIALEELAARTSLDPRTANRSGTPCLDFSE